MLEESPPSEPVPTAADPTAALLVSPAENTDKVNELGTDRSESAVDSVLGSARESDSGSGYKESESNYTRNSLFNYSGSG
jgi:hypothetical protein